GSKSSSYRQWAEALEGYEGSERLLSQLGYWEEIARGGRRLRVARTGSDRVKASEMSSVRVKLGSELTRQLLQGVPEVYHTEINDLLLGARAGTMSGWTGRPEVVIGLEGHGRESGIAEGIDTSRTVGWFTTMYPVLLEMPASNGEGAVIKSVKERL